MTPEDVMEVVIPMLLLGSGVVFAVCVWHLSRALGVRIRRWGERPVAAREPSAEVLESQAAVLGELESLRREVAELGERVDFAERLLARQREAERLAPPS